MKIFKLENWNIESLFPSITHHKSNILLKLHNFTKANCSRWAVNEFYILSKQKVANKIWPGTSDLGQEEKDKNMFRTDIDM